MMRLSLFFMNLKKMFLLPDFSCIFRADQVMTKPEITKKISTPIHPCRNQARG